MAACRGEKKFPPARLPDSMPGRRLCLAAVYYNRVCKGRNGKNGDAESRVLVSERGAPDGLLALLSWKVSQSSPVNLDYMSLQLLVPITSSTWVSLHAVSHQLRFLGTGISCHYL